MSLLMSINISSETGHHGKHSQMSLNGLLSQCHQRNVWAEMDTRIDDGNNHES